jgi:hypothetical protein
MGRSVYNRRIGRQGWMDGGGCSRARKANDYGRGGDEG